MSLNSSPARNIAPFFLTVEDIVRFAREKEILHQGRGSAANSAVCYALGITEVDPDRDQTFCSSASFRMRATSRRISMSISSMSGAKRSSNISTSASGGIAPGFAPPSFATAREARCAKWARRLAYRPM